MDTNQPTQPTATATPKRPRGRFRGDGILPECKEIHPWPPVSQRTLDWIAAGCPDRRTWLLDQARQQTQAA